MPNALYQGSLLENRQEVEADKETREAGKWESEAKENFPRGGELRYTECSPLITQSSIEGWIQTVIFQLNESLTL